MGRGKAIGEQKKKKKYLKEKTEDDWLLVKRRKTSIESMSKKCHQKYLRLKESWGNPRERKK